jgi:hypothetical protein
VKYRHSPEQIAELLDIRWWDWELSQVVQEVDDLTNDDVLTSSLISTGKTLVGLAAAMWMLASRIWEQERYCSFVLHTR